MNKFIESPSLEATHEKNDFGSEKRDKIFSTNTKRHEDLKEMLDSSKDNLKLDAMKRIIGMIAKGKNASHLFPAVVKNVASKNLEVKKLVYVYLVRYAEEQQDLALLSISTFQKGLKDSNQLIRASALRVLSSIRVSMISPILMLALKDAMRDMSPYVRKTAALAVPKIYTLDPELKDSLVEVIETLLSDRSTMVIGSAMMSFEIVCPEREDLLKRIFNRLARICASQLHLSSHQTSTHSAQGVRAGGFAANDALWDEWSICQVLYTLTRFASRRLILDSGGSCPLPVTQTQTSDLNDLTFNDSKLLFPKIGDTKTKYNKMNQNKSTNLLDTDDFLNGDDHNKVEETIHEPELPNPPKKPSVIQNQSIQQCYKPRTLADLHPDLILLLRSCKPFLQSRNSAVVMSVIQLYYHCGPFEELSVIVKPLIRLLRGHTEVQCVVLKCIASLLSNSASNSFGFFATPQNHDSQGFAIDNSGTNLSNPVKCSQSNSLRSLFESHLKSFYVNHNDSTHVKLLKLDILTSLANETNIALILRELQTYVTSQDKDFASATIVCIGQCAQSIPSIQQSCTNGLLALMHSSNESVVSESVIVIKNLLKLGDRNNTQSILTGMCKILVDSYENAFDSQDQTGNDLESSINDNNNNNNNDTKYSPNTGHKILDSKAVACILWLLCEYGDAETYVTKLPDLLRIMVRRFNQQDNLVKLQIINLASRLYAFLSLNQEAIDSYCKYKSALLSTVDLLVKYVFDLVKYDTNYDIRDKGRMLRHILDLSQSNSLNADTENNLKFGLGEAKKPLVELQQHLFQFSGTGRGTPTKLNYDNSDDLLNNGSNLKPMLLNTDVIGFGHGRHGGYQLGTLSHYLNNRVEGYRDITISPGESQISTDQVNAFNDIDWWAIEEPPAAQLTNGVEEGGSSFSDQRGTNYKEYISSPLSGENIPLGLEVRPDLITNGARNDKDDYEKFLGGDDDSVITSALANDKKDSSSSTSISSSEDSSDNKDTWQHIQNKANMGKKTTTSTPKATSTKKDLSESSSPESTSYASSEDDFSLADNFLGPKKSSTEKLKSSKSTLNKNTKVKSSGNDSKISSMGNKSQHTNDIDSLLSLVDFSSPTLHTSKNALANFDSTNSNNCLTPMNMLQPKTFYAPKYQHTNPTFVSSLYNDLSPAASEQDPLQVAFRFTRKAHFASAHGNSPALLNIELKFLNTSTNSLLENIRMIDIDATKMQPFYEISLLNPSQEALANIGVNFNDSTQPVKFTLTYGLQKRESFSNKDNTDTVTPLKKELSLCAPLGEQTLPIILTNSQFLQEQSKLGGMNETTQNIYTPSLGHSKSSTIQAIFSDTSNDIVLPFSQTATQLINALQRSFNLYCLPVMENSSNSPNVIRFSGQTWAEHSLVLLQIERILKDSAENSTKFHLKIRVNCEKMIISNLFIKDVMNVINAFFKTV